MRKGWLNNETIQSLASSRNHTGNDAIDNVDNYVKEWWRVSPEEETTIHRSTMKLMDKLYKALKQRDQYKAERDTLIDDLSWYKAKVSRLEQRHSKLVDENTRLQNELYTMGLNQDEADDKIKELERENENLRLEDVAYFDEWQVLKMENKLLVKDNKALRIQSNTYFDEWQEAEKQRSEFVELFNKSNELLSEISQHIGNKPSSSTYKYFREKLNALEIKEDE